MQRPTLPGWVLLALLSGIAHAHHSSAMFDKTVVREVAATVREFQWTNPHIWIEIEIENEGAIERWSIEGGGTNTLFRRGWRPNTFTAGDDITIRFNPMKDGSHAGGFIGAKLPDGTVIGNWD